MRKITLLLLILVSFLPLSGQQKKGEIGVEEKLGQSVPMDLNLIDEEGDSLKLSEIIEKPTILSLVYYRCAGMCPRILMGLVDVLEKLDLEPGKDFQVLTVSFDDRDTPKMAKEKKKNYLGALRREFPQDAWRFFVADSITIQALTQSVGFHFRRTGDMFQHPASLIILSPKGKIVRYHYGVDYLPFELKMSLLEASEGRVGSTARRLLLFCFSYDPESRKYVFNVMKVSGVVVLFFLTAFVGFLVATGRKRKDG
jgi:protein SCO1/2